jgi:hypothetical protein
MDDVSSIRSNAESLDGEVVEIDARLVQAKVSVEETMEEGTATCNPNKYPIPTGQGQPICKNMRADELLQAGAAWSTVPQSREGVLPVVGVSSNRQDQPITTENGTYEIVGEVVSSSRIDEDLPDGSVLLIYDMERTGDVDYQEVRSEGREIIKTKRNEFATRLLSQVEQDDVQVDASRISTSANSVGTEEEDTDTDGGNAGTSNNNDGEGADSDSGGGEQEEDTSGSSDTEQTDQSSDGGGIGEIISDIISGLFVGVNT